VIRSGANLDQKVTYFHQMLWQDFALAEISRFVLGPYWRVASGAQRREFRSLFEDYLAHYYGQQFSQYGGESLRVNGGSRSFSAMAGKSPVSSRRCARRFKATDLLKP